MINVDPLSPDPADLEALAALLEQSGAYRVLRQLTPRLAKPPPPDMKTRIGLFVDVETTERDEIIELAMVPFTYGSQGELYEVGEAYSALREPTRPIPPEVTAITGIDAGSVAGRGIDPGEVAARVAPAALVVAHNAAFDRRFLERFCESFTLKPWAAPCARSIGQGRASRGPSSPI